MSMNLAKQTFEYSPDYLIAGTYPIITATKTAASALSKGAPVILNGSGKAAKLSASDNSVDTSGLYGILAEDAAENGAAIIYLTGEFFADKLEFETGVVASDVEIPFRKLGIFLK